MLEYSNNYDSEQGQYIPYNFPGLDIITTLLMMMFSYFKSASEIIVTGFAVSIWKNQLKLD
jgi:hypothetical protein